MLALLALFDTIDDLLLLPVGGLDDVGDNAPAGGNSRPVDVDVDDAPFLLMLLLVRGLVVVVVVRAETITMVSIPSKQLL